jgi:hypothetical protein
MAYNPAAKTVVKVEINTTALGWVDVTARGRSASCVITQGRSANAIQAEASRMQLILGNPDGYLTEDNAVSPYYGSWGRGCEIRVTRPDLSGTPERFHGQVDSITERFSGGNEDATVEITAIGSLGILAQGSDSLKSALTRAMDGISEGDFRPVAHWPMEGAAGTVKFGSTTAGVPAAVASGDVSAAAYNGASGSDAVPVLNDGGQIAGSFPPMTITPNGSGEAIWQLQFMAVISSSLAANATFADVNVQNVGGDSVIKWRFDWDNTFKIFTARPFTSLGTTLVGAAVDIGSNPSFYDRPLLFALSVYQLTVGGIVNHQFSAKYPGVSGLSGSNVIGAGLTTTIPVPQSWRAYGVAANAGWTFSHLGLYTDPAIFDFPNHTDNAAALDGYTGERSATRQIRLCREEGVAFELVGDEADTPPMGPQLIDTLIANLRDCEKADQGLMHDNGTDGAIVHVTRTHLYNQTATVAVVRGSIEPGLEATRDRQYTRNDITSSRPNGGSARVADETHVAKIRARIKDSRSVNLETDDQLRNDAAWAVHLGTAEDARYNSVGINLRNADGALLADDIAAHVIGDRLTVATTALPPQHTSGIDGLTVGWTEYLDADTWRLRANVMPYQPYEVFVVEDDVRGRLDTDGSQLQSAATSTSTSWTVVSTDAQKPLWITTAGRSQDFPFDVGAAGERATVTAIAGMVADPFTRTTSNGWGSTPEGYAWSNFAPNSEYATGGTSATMSLASVGSTRQTMLNAVSVATADVSVQAQTAVLATGAYIGAAVMLRRLDANNYFFAELRFFPNQSIDIAIVARVGGTETELAAKNIGATHAINTPYGLRVAISGTTLLAKGWRVSSGEPRRWTLRATSSSLASANPVGVRGVLAGGNTNTLPVVLTVDDFTVNNPQVFTVTRSVNGVVKALAAGDAVSLWKPAVIAL